MLYHKITGSISRTCLLVYEMLRSRHLVKCVGRFIWKRTLKSKLFSTFFLFSIETASSRGKNVLENIIFMRIFAMK